jgi:2,3-bisphosphoglycerate-independent phosphoglycerate mutase
VSPTSSVRDLAELPEERLATVVGRYYAMDRDQRWERTDRALSALIRGEGVTVPGTVQEVRRQYDAGVTDEFLEPIVLEGKPRIGPHDQVVFFNFRPDRGRQLTERLVASGRVVTTMTRYRDDFPCPVAFAELEVHQALAQVLAEHRSAQLHAAETEKYAHVTYFFNGGREKAWPGEGRILVPSPRTVPSYDHRPEMSARELTQRFAQAVAGGALRFALVNFANPDMVGHTGSIPAVITAVETVDECLGRVVDAVRRVGGVGLVTADHGNAEVMLEDDGISPHTAHTTNPVPLVVTNSNLELRAGGGLCDLAPTVLDLLKLPKPLQMTGKSLLGGCEA